MAAGELIRGFSLVAISFLYSSVAVLAGMITRGEKAPAAVMGKWGRALIRAGGFTVRVEGAGNLPEGGAVLVSNHQSVLDIPLLIAAFDREIRFLAKRELKGIPVFGRAMTLAGNLFVDRDDPRDSVHLVREAGFRMKRGQVIVVFPEGTRSVDGTIGDFKPGAFLLARRSGAPVLPVYIEGGRDAMPKGSLRLKRGTLRVVVLPPLASEGDRRLSRDEMAELARRRIEGAREALEGRPRAVL